MRGQGLEKTGGAGFSAGEKCGAGIPPAARRPEHRGETAMTKTFGKLAFLIIFSGLVFWSVPAVAGQFGIVSCTTPACGYQENLTIGGLRNAPGVTGYCQSTKKFVRLKLKSHDDVRKTHYCPGSNEPMILINSDSKIPEIPCPKSGKLTLN
jgi:hypothetical protein